MPHILHQLLDAHSVVLLYIWGECFVSNAYGAYKDTHVGFRVVPLFWLVVGLLAFVAWFILVFLT